MHHRTELELGSVRLRPSDLEDAACVIAWLDPEMWRGMSTAFPDEAALRADLSSRTAAPATWCFTVEADGEVVGLTSYYEMVPWKLEVGSTVYARRVWGTSVNPACKLLLLGHAFDVLGVERVALRCDARNERSFRAIERLGASYEGTLRQFRPAGTGGLADVAYFSVLRREWPGVRAGLRARLG